MLTKYLLLLAISTCVFMMSMSQGWLPTPGLPLILTPELELFNNLSCGYTVFM